MVECCNELNTGYAADGYARALETRTAVVVIPYIVGGLSILNAISGARSERLKVIVISGCPSTTVFVQGKATHHTPSPTNKDHALHAFQGVTAASVRVTTAESAADVIDDAVVKCVKKSLPVYIEVPQDIADAQCRVPRPLNQKLEEAKQPNRNIEALKAIRDVWDSANRPVLLIGGQVQVSLSRETIQRLVDTLGCPVFCQPNGRWISESHPQYWGPFWPGILDSDGENAVKNSDLWLGLGTAWSDLHSPAMDQTTNKHRIVSIQYDRVDLPNDRVIEMVELGDLVLALIESGISNKPASLPHFKLSHPAHIQAEIKNSEDPLAMTSLFTGIQNTLKEHSTLVADVGDTWFAACHLKLPPGVDFHMQLPYASMGWGVPATLGAQIARSQGRVVLLVGDGAFQMTAQEISTMVRMKLNPIIFLFNNLGYKAEVSPLALFMCTTPTIGF
jgi:pyruvate decarboxylase